MCHSQIESLRIQVYQHKIQLKGGIPASELKSQIAAIQVVTGFNLLNVRHLLGRFSYKTLCFSGLLSATANLSCCLPSNILGVCSVIWHSIHLRTSMMYVVNGKNSEPLNRLFTSPFPHKNLTGNLTEPWLDKMR